MNAFIAVCLAIHIAGASGGEEAAPRVPVAAVLVDDFPGAGKELPSLVAAEVASAGYAVRELSAADLVAAGALDAARIDLVVLAGARALPAEIAAPLEAFLESGGDLLALGLPAWGTPLAKVKGKWMSRKDYENVLSGVKPEKVLFDFESGDLSAWRRSASPGAPRATHSIEVGDGGKALRAVFDSVPGWDVLSSPALEKPFPGGHTITCFRAKGGPRTRRLSVEWVEGDGARWIAVVGLEESWKTFALPPEAFLAWEPPPGRGKKGDRLRVESATRITFGLAHSHMPIEPGRQEFWVDDVGTAASPFPEAAPPEKLDFPRLESLCPGYLFYPMTGPVKVATPEGLALAGEVSADPPRDLLGIHPRPRGVGFEKGRHWRWQPLLVARAGGGDFRGTLAALVANLKPPYEKSVWVAFTPMDLGFYRQPAVRGLLRETARALRRGAFLEEGGSEFFTVHEGRPVRLGARAANFGVEPAELEIRLEVREAGSPKARFSQVWPLRWPPFGREKVEAAFDPEPWPPGGFTVLCELLEGKQVIDRLSHELHVLRPKEKPSFIEARDGGLWQGGLPWKAHGVNYMPSSGIAMGLGSYFEHWIGREAYDPEVIDRDLRRIRDMGMNAVSVFIHHQSLAAGNLIDFLRRAEALGLRVNQSLRPGTPMDFRWAEMREIIERARLPQSDTVFAYDLAWEPSHHNYSYQKPYAPLWSTWVTKRHGSLEAAEKAWGVPAPREGGELSVPPAENLVKNGPWRKLTADYRLFLDDLVGERYGEARRLVRSIDPSHPVSFRMQHAGDPTLNWDQLLPYDFPGLAGAVDIWEPEAYGRIGGWDIVKAGRFTADYARLCDPGKPLIWAEMGTSVWDMGTMAPDPGKLEFAARFYGDFYRMLRDSGADGVFFWWYPGGFRLGESSDFGILNPDGTDRPVTRVIRAEGKEFLRAPKPPSPDHWISVDRDRDARGLFGIYEAVRDEYWKAIEEGKTPGLRWAKKPGERR
jgi:hypothetical protein